MVEVTVCVDDMDDGQSVGGQCFEDAVGIVAGVDDHRLACFFTAEDKTVCLNRAQSHLADNHFFPPEVVVMRIASMTVG
jgi:hypothetical protein